MKVTVHGTGYVGLVTGACLAEAGNHVTCVDIDQGKVAMLERGEIPIYEPGLEAIVRRNHAAGRLLFTTDVAAGVRYGELQFIAVGTPKNEDGSADLRHVLAVATSIGEHLDGYKVIVDKSTVPVGTADRVHETVAGVLAKRGIDTPFDVVSNPEFLKEGAAVGDFMKPDRIIVGTESPRATELLRQLYEPFSRNHDKLIVMDVRSAELTKYAANVMLATKISLMNELANIAERYGADVEQVRVGIGSDPRIGYSFIYPGCGYGGSCFPKDVNALMFLAREHRVPLQVVNAVDAVNTAQKGVLFDKLTRALETLQGARIAVWGLAFKPRTDDVREAPALVLIEKLLAAGAEVRAHDPEARATARAALGPLANKVIFVDHPYDATVGADALVLVTEWQEYRSPDFDLLKEQMRRRVLFDGRNVWHGLAPEKLGFRYEGIGLTPR